MTESGDKVFVYALDSGLHNEAATCLPYQQQIIHVTAHN